MKKTLISITALVATILPFIAISSPAKAAYENRLQVNHGVNINNIDTMNAQQVNPWKQTSFKIAKCNGYETNKFDKKAKVAAGGWTVSWAKDISETDVGLGLVAAGVSIYDGSASFQVWAENLVRRTISSLGENLSENVKAELTTILKKVLFDAIQGKSAKNTFKKFDTFDFKAGAIKYSGKNRFLCNTVSTTWGMKPYVAFRIGSSSKKPSQSSSAPSPTVQKIGVPNLMIQTPGYPVIAVFSKRKESFALGCHEIRNMWSRISVKNVSSREYNSVQANNPVVADLRCDGSIKAYAPTNEPGALLIKYRNGSYYRHYIDSPDFITALKSGNLIPIPVSEFRANYPNRGTDFKAFR